MIRSLGMVIMCGEIYGDDVIDDGGGWVLVIQFTDGTINQSWGNEAPDGLIDFVAELIGFTRSREPNR